MTTEEDARDEYVDRRGKLEDKLHSLRLPKSKCRDRLIDLAATTHDTAMMETVAEFISLISDELSLQFDLYMLELAKLATDELDDSEPTHAAARVRLIMDSLVAHARALEEYQGKIIAFVNALPVSHRRRATKVLPKPPPAWNLPPDPIKDKIRNLFNKDDPA